MEVPIKRKWTIASLMAVVFPTSLLATLRLTGILPEPREPETIMVETVDWKMTRPMDHTTVDELVNNSYGNGVSIDFGVLVVGYHEDEQGFPSCGNDYIQLALTAVANSVTASSIP